jgi:hypothetical protein
MLPLRPWIKKLPIPSLFYRDKEKKQKVDVGFVTHSFASTCRRPYVSRDSNKINAEFDECGSSAGDCKRMVHWVKNNVMGIGWPPPSWSPRYLATYYRSDTWGGRVYIPDKFDFVIWGQFVVGDFPIPGNGYICEAVMLGFTLVPRTDYFDTTSKDWTLITNTSSPYCWSSHAGGFTATLPIECKKRADRHQTVVETWIHR